MFSGTLTSEPNPQTCLETSFRNRIRNSVFRRTCRNASRHASSRGPGAAPSASTLCTTTTTTLFLHGKETFVKFRYGFFDDGLEWACKVNIRYTEQHRHQFRPISRSFRKFGLSLCNGSIGTVSSDDFIKACTWPGFERYPFHIAVLRIRKILVWIRMR